MIEVESKVKISESKLKTLISKISSLSIYQGKEKKIDDYYTLQSLSSYPKKSLRVRKHPSFYEVNFKKSLSYKSGVHAKNEVEFQVSDIKRFLALIDDFGFKKWLTKIKTTHLYKIKPNFHIELNHVKSLGWFIEVEYLVKNKSQISKARKQVYNVIKSLGFSEKDIVKSGYTKLLWNLKHKK